ncbi:MAG: ROK family protein [Planctomycetota bacterium]|nr:MAG: ROK family protein [Planctomycetota bacterium]
MKDRSRWLPAAQARAPLYAGVDLGGTNIKVGLVDDAGRTLAFHTEPTLVERGPEDVCRRMGQAVQTVASLAGVPVERIARAGLGTPGPQDLAGGWIIHAGNFPGFEGFNVRDAVSRHSGLPVTFANDATAAGYGEYWIGSGKGLTSLVLLTLGTGVGGGIVIGEATVDGAHSHASECGHIIVDPSAGARKCPCGQTGHLEAYASATSLVLMAREAVAAGQAPALARALAGGVELTPILIGGLAREGDVPAMDLILESARWLGIGIVSLLHTLDPACVVLGGAMSFGGEDDIVGWRFIVRIRQEIQARAFAILAEQTPIRFAMLGGDAGYIGAAGLARLEHRRLSGATLPAPQSL